MKKLYSLLLIASLGASTVLANPAMVQPAENPVVSVNVADTAKSAPAESLTQFDRSFNMVSQMGSKRLKLLLETAWEGFKPSFERVVSSVTKAMNQFPEAVRQNFEAEIQAFFINMHAKYNDRLTQLASEFETASDADQLLIVSQISSIVGLVMAEYYELFCSKLLNPNTLQDVVASTSTWQLVQVKTNQLKQAAERNLRAARRSLAKTLKYVSKEANALVQDLR